MGIMRIRVLIVDDHDMVRFALISSLSQSNDIEIIGEATDGSEAVNHCLGSHPDVVLMDIRMPHMNGITATKLIKEKLPDTRILILSSTDDREDMLAALAAGANGYCLKDANPERLALAVQAVSSGATWLDPQIASVVLSSVTAAAPSIAAPKKVKEPMRTELSAAEFEILQLLVDGLSNAEIAERLFQSLESLETQIKSIMEKLQVNDRIQAALKAMNDGLI